MPSGRLGIAFRGSQGSASTVPRYSVRMIPSAKESTWAGHSARGTAVNEIPNGVGIRIPERLAARRIWPEASTTRFGVTVMAASSGEATRRRSVYCPSRAARAPTTESLRAERWTGWARWTSVAPAARMSLWGEGRRKMIAIAASPTVPASSAERIGERPSRPARMARALGQRSSAAGSRARPSTEVSRAGRPRQSARAGRSAAFQWWPVAASYTTIPAA